MSSGSFEVELTIDARGRQIVFWSGIILAIAGSALILTIPGGWSLRWLLMALWIADVMIGISRLRRGWAACEGLQLGSTGDICVRDPDGARRPVRLATGTLVTAWFAWLRYSRPGGHTCAEFLIRRSAGDRCWHRLQVIWRLARSAFGQPARA